MIIDVKSRYMNEQVKLVTGFYGDGSTAIQGFGMDGQPVFTATVALNIIPQPGNVFIKSWSENEGLYEVLLKAGVIGEKVDSHQAGYATAFECPLLVSL